jgi:hypothetical protein
MRTPLALVLAAALAVPAFAASQARDLGLGLTYFRVHNLPADLPAEASARGHPCVLDLRYVAGGGAEAAALGSWVASHSAPRTPVLLLANAGTSRALLAGLGSPDSVPGLVILGAAAPGFQPDVAVSTSTETEHRAYAALDNGAPIDSLVTESIDKPRNDEAMLAREHLPDSALGDDGEPDAADATGRRAAPRQLIDAVLQRAVQLHRTLLALKRL